MIAVRFIGLDGHVTDTFAARGERLLDIAQSNGQPLEGTCEGQMACATCHVVIDPEAFILLPRASRDEEEMLDLAHSATRHSRLACQIRLADPLASITVYIPPDRP